MSDATRHRLRTALAVVGAIAAAAFMLFAGFFISGAGEGWYGGAVASLPLSVVSLGSVYSVLAGRRGRRLPWALSLIAGVSCALAAVNAVSDLNQDNALGFIRVLNYHKDLLVLYALACSMWLSALLFLLLRRST